MSSEVTIIDEPSSDEETAETDRSEHLTVKDIGDKHHKHPRRTSTPQGTIEVLQPVDHWNGHMLDYSSTLGIKFGREKQAHHRPLPERYPPILYNNNQVRWDGVEFGVF